MKPQTVCVVGAGYVGLTAAAGLAELGHEVRCVEADASRLGTLVSGGVPIHEPEMASLVARNVAAGRLAFTDDLARAIAGAGVAFLCVGTPPRPDGDPDLRQLAAAAVAAAGAATGDVVLVVKSTVPPGSCEALELLADGQARHGLRVHVASNPEFLREGQAVWDFFNPDRVVVGAEDPRVAARVSQLYPDDWPLVVCDRRSAELVKYAANTFLALKISFANEVATLCESLGAEASKVLGGVGLDSRIGGAFLAPGPGFGGSCLPKDLSGFVAVAESAGVPAVVARAAQKVNAAALVSLVSKLEAALGPLDGRRIGVLGLAFKPGTDDIRHSPSLALVERLVGRGARVRAHDPVARVSGGPFEQVDDPYDAIAGADAVVVATAWPTYRGLEAPRVAQAMSGHVLLDAVNLLDVNVFTIAGLDVYGVGAGRATSFVPVPCRPLEWMLDPGELEVVAGR